MKKIAIAAAVSALVGATGAGAAPRQLGNYDAFTASLAKNTATTTTTSAKISKKTVAKLVGSARGPRGMASNYDSKLNAHTFLWVQDGKSIAAKSAGMPLKRSALAESVARDAIRGHLSVLAAGRNGVDAAQLVDVQDSGKGAIVARFQQKVGGVEVFNRKMSVLMDGDLSPKAISGYFAPDAQLVNAAKSATHARIAAADAIVTAFAQLQGKVNAGALQVAKTSGDYTLYTVPQSSENYRIKAQPRVKQVLYPGSDTLRSAYYVEIEAGYFDVGQRDSYAFVVDANDGSILFRKDLTSYEAYSYQVYADADGIHQPFDGPLGNANHPSTAGPYGPFDRTPATMNTVTIQNGPISTNDPWLPAGATVTTGNNVDAYVDLDDDGSINDGYTPNGADFRADVTASNAFIYPFTPDADSRTTQQRKAAIVNLFYINNWLHDWWYGNGYDEAAGNAQTDNYGRGGVGGDPVLAEGQDGSGTDNANMSTPSDGGSPRMQMFMWTGPYPSALNVSSPAELAGNYNFGIGASFTPQSFDVSGQVVAYQVASGASGCSAPSNPAEVVGKIVIMDRGTCNFVAKAQNAQNAGAIGVLIAGTPDAGVDAVTMGGTFSGTIPAMSISYADGQKLYAASNVTVRMQRAAQAPDRDGTMDNGIIAHEWFHHVSNRLVGNANGLSTQQAVGMGEGWSDFSAMMLIVREEDRAVTGNDHWQGAYSPTTYAIENQYFGIRRTPYSTDMNIDPLTFKHIAYLEALPAGGQYLPGTDTTGSSNYEAHATGEIWANTLWEIYAALLNDPRYTFAQAQDRMKSYIIAGLKMTPSAPTMLEARDALLAVAAATDEGDFELMAKAFAKRGMGYGAIGPDRDNTDNTGITESYEPFGSSFAVDGTSLDFAYEDGVNGYCDLDNVLDVGETAQLKVTIRSTGTQGISGPITATVSGPAGISFPNGPTITFYSLGLIGSTAEGTVLVHLDSALQAQKMALQISFPQIGDDEASVGEPDTQTIELTTNYDLEKVSASDSLDDPLASQRDWTTSDAVGGQGSNWTVTKEFDSYFSSGNVWYGPDNDSASDIRLETPELDVSSTPFAMSFRHYYAMELFGYDDNNIPLGYDGAVLEISVDGGEWQDAMTGDYAPSVSGGHGYNGRSLAFGGDENDSTNWRAAFVATSENGFEPVTLDFGTKLAGRKIKLRFREVSDAGGGDTGWIVDDVSFSGLSNLPFSKIVANAGSCTNRPPHVDAGADQTVQGVKKGAHQSLTLHGVVTDRDGLNLERYSWTQIAGPTVKIKNADTLTPTIEVPRVDADTALQFRLTVSDGTQSASDDTSVTVTQSPAGSTGGGAMGFGLLGLLPLAMLRRRRKNV